MLEILSSPNFKPGRLGTMLSLSPNSEPLKTAQSVDFTQQALHMFLPLGNPVQIPTKEAVPQDLVDTIDLQTTYEGQVVIFTSLSSMKKADRLEPNAAPVEVRIANAYQLVGAMCRTCAYIKPFLRSALSEVDEFIAHLSLAPYDYICVGMRYQAASALQSRLKNREIVTANLAGRTHPVRSSIVATGITGPMRAFAKIIADSCKPTLVFMTSTCVSAHAAGREPPIPIWTELPELCIRCRECGIRETS
jgi:hypothetical protein